MMKHIAFAVLLMTLFTTNAQADFDAGKSAYERGDFATALREWQPLADQGRAEAQFYLGRMHESGEGVPQDYSQALRWYRKAAEQGHADAQCNIGTLYFDGLGVQRDYNQAVAWFRKAAEQGQSQAQYNLGVAYLDGHGLPRNKAEALNWFRKSAEKGCARAQTNIGVAYADGDGVPKDYAEAVKWLKKAADQGDMKAQSNIGLMYANGEGVPKDDAQAVIWFRRAADSGFADGMYNLGVVTAQGKGVPKDLVQALMWLELAVLHGSEMAPRARDVVARNMSGSEIATAKKLAQVWKPKSNLGTKKEPSLSSSLSKPNSPSQVLEAFLTAANAGDYGKAKTLSLPGALLDMQNEKDIDKITRNRTIRKITILREDEVAFTSFGDVGEGLVHVSFTIEFENKDKGNYIAHVRKKGGAWRVHFIQPELALKLPQ
ncbi:MAG: hypothetical protein NT178_07060 [Proteobacteria bacterium]|nr:hypothetical protein [Pseudomonadota bacterium]